MLGRILVAGAGGGVVLVLWSFVTNVLLGFRSRIDLNRVANEGEVHALLKQNVTAPGAYVVNPPLTPDGRFPPGEPVFGVRYGGMGHEAAGGLFLVELAVAFVAALLAAWLVSRASGRTPMSPWRAAGLLALVGALIAVYSDLPRAGIAGYPWSSVLLLGAHDIAAWLLCGLAIGWLLRRAGGKASLSARA